MEIKGRVFYSECCDSCVEGNKEIDFGVCRTCVHNTGCLDCGNLTSCVYGRYDAPELKPLTIDVVYHKCNPYLEKIDIGDWVDLRAIQTYEINKGDFCMLDLGVSMRLPDGYEAVIAPRSSLFKSHGLLQTNGIGVIDNTYCGTYDIWKMPVYATRDTIILGGERVCQFRIQRSQPSIKFQSVDALMERGRGGFGGTGKY